MIAASWGKQIASGFKLVIQCFPSIVLASVFIFDVAADTNTVTDRNSDTDAVMETDPETNTDGDILSWLVPGGRR